MMLCWPTPPAADPLFSMGRLVLGVRLRAAGALAAGKLHLIAAASCSAVWTVWTGAWHASGGGMGDGLDECNTWGPGVRLACNLQQDVTVG